MSRKEKIAGYFIFGLFMLSLLLEILRLWASFYEMTEIYSIKVPITFIIRSLVSSLIYRIPTILIGVFCLPAFSEKRILLRISIIIFAILSALSELSSIRTFLDDRRSMDSSTFKLILALGITYIILMTVLMILYYRSAFFNRKVMLVIFSALMFVSVLKWIVTINPFEYSDFYELPIKLDGLNVFVSSAAILLMILFIRPGKPTSRESNTESIETMSPGN